MDNYIVIIFESTHLAIKTEKLLSGLDIDMIPTPRQLNANCGISIKADISLLSSIKDKMGISYGDKNLCYEVNKVDGELTFIKR